MNEEDPEEEENEEEEEEEEEEAGGKRRALIDKQRMNGEEQKEKTHVQMVDCDLFPADRIVSAKEVRKRVTTCLGAGSVYCIPYYPTAHN